MPEQPYYNVSMESLGASPDTQHLEDLVEVLEDLGARGASVGAGGMAAGASAVFSLDVSDYGPESLRIVLGRATDIFATALDKAGIPLEAIARADVMAGPHFERWLSEPGDEFAGVTEVARILGVSKQRVSELRARPDFPAPSAELAAGPVWKVTNLWRFINGWERKPGRPRRRAPEQEKTRATR